MKQLSMHSVVASSIFRKAQSTSRANQMARSISSQQASIERLC